MRKLTPAIRRELGIPEADARPYRWGFAVLVVALVAVPLLLAKMAWAAGVVAAAALVGVPLVRRIEQGELRLRERAFEEGDEARGVVLRVEPGGDGGRDRPVHVELEDGRKLVVRGSPLARRGLGPGDSVLLFVQGSQAVLVARIDKAPPPREGAEEDDHGG